MIKHALLAGFLGAAALLAGLPSGAQAQQHWFFGNYGQYDEEAYYPQPRYRQPYYYPAYPRPWFWRGHPRDEIVEYKVGPREWVRVYPDGRQELVTRPRRKLADPNPSAKVRQSQKPAVKAAVPLPKSKPSTSVAETATNDELPAPNATTGKDLPASATAALEPPIAKEEGEVRAREVDPVQTGSLKAVTCEEAQGIVSDFGFSDVKATSCSGGTYEIEAMRDGKPFAIKLSAADGELTEVKKR